MADISRSKRATVWQYFDREENVKLAECRLCQKMLSFKTSITNLKKHLLFKHRLAYQELTGEDSSPAAKSKHAGGLDEDSNEAIKYSSEILSYFEQENGRARCVVCCETSANNLEDLKNHLHQNHPKLLAQISKDIDYVESGAVSESDGNGNETLFTEVVYLEDEKEKQTKIYKKSPKMHTKHQTPRKKFTRKSEKRERNDSSSSDEIIKKRKKSCTDDELDTFVTYIACLLKKLPKDVSSKLQMDIINLIMNAKLNKSSENNIVLDSSLLTLQNLTTPNSNNTHPFSERKESVSVPNNMLVPHTSTSVTVPNPVLSVNSYSITVPDSNVQQSDDK